MLFGKNRNTPNIRHNESCTYCQFGKRISHAWSRCTKGHGFQGKNPSGYKCEDFLPKLHEAAARKHATDDALIALAKSMPHSQWAEISAMKQRAHYASTRRELEQISTSYYHYDEASEGII